MCQGMSYVPLVSVHKMPCVAEAENALLLGRQVSEKSSVQPQGRVSVVRNILRLQLYRGIMVAIEQRVPDLENRMRLPMDSRSIKHDDRARGALHVHSLALPGSSPFLARVQ